MLKSGLISKSKLLGSIWLLIKWKKKSKLERFCCLLKRKTEIQGTKIFSYSKIDFLQNKRLQCWKKITDRKMVQDKRFITTSTNFHLILNARLNIIKFPVFFLYSIDLHFLSPSFTRQPTNALAFLKNKIIDIIFIV